MLTKSKPVAAAEAEQPKGEPPLYRAWIVTDGMDGAKPVWSEITGLWAIQNGDGLTGQIRRPLPQIAGHGSPRLVILPNTRD